MDVVGSILDIPVQYPSEEFSSADLNWKKVGTAEHHDFVAVIPYAQVDTFIIGECSNIESPTRFHIERGRKRSMGSLKNYSNDEYLEHRLYWCSFGPENYGEGGDILPSRRYRLNTRNRAARPQSMRGCTCHFVVKRLYARPSLAVILYNDRRHVNKSGFVCHGPLDGDAIGPGAMKTPYICNEIKQQTMSMIYLGIPEENVLEKHIEGIQRYCGANTKVNGLASQYVHKLGMIIKRSTHELDLDDQASIQIWTERNKKSIFFYQEPSETNAFILGIQTDWQLQQMIRFGHRSLMAADSTFGIKRLKYPLCTLLVFDSIQHALPVAWVITRSFARLDVSNWMKALHERVRIIEPGWKISGFLIDDAAAEIESLRDIFCCPVLFSLWRLRRSWLRNIIKKSNNVEIQREIFKRLGKIIYGIWGGIDSSVALDEFHQDFIDQTDFMHYFKTCWMPKIDMWLTTMRTLPLASQEASSAIEAYHVKLKIILFDDSHLNALQRVDYLVHKLTTDLHSSYWLDRYAHETDSFENINKKYMASTSWHRALQIPDDSIHFDNTNNTLIARVRSQQKDSNQTRIVWNPGSEFAFCDCHWSMRGNLCKHVIKLQMLLCGNSKSMSLLSFREVLMTLWKNPMDDSVAMDQSVAWVNQILGQIRQLVELGDSKEIGCVVDKMPLKWVTKKVRTFSGKQASTLLGLPSNTKRRNGVVLGKKNLKRKRVLQLK